jgi:hypothetical protein
MQSRPEGFATCDNRYEITPARTADNKSRESSSPKMRPLPRAADPERWPVLVAKRVPSDALYVGEGEYNEL